MKMLNLKYRKSILKNRSVSVTESSSSKINSKYDKSLKLMRANNVLSSLEQHNQTYDYSNYPKRKIPDSSDSELYSLYRKKSVELPGINTRLRKNIAYLNPITGDARSQLTMSQKKHYANDYKTIDVGRVKSRRKDEHIYNFY